MQRCKRGHIASRVVTIHDEDDVVCVKISAQHQRRRCHFIKVLNVVSQYDDGELGSVRQLDVITSLDVPPSADDVVAAMQQLKNGKTVGGSGVLPEMLKVRRACPDFVALLVDFLGVFWRGDWFLMTGRMLFLSLFLRRVTCIAVTTGKEFLCRTLLVSFWAGLCKIICRNWLRRPCLSHSAGLGGDAAAPM